MEDRKRQKLLARNEQLIRMVIERAQRDFPEDIAIIGLTGSFSTGDYHCTSDLDLIIINNTDRGWGISSCFILDDIGYDIYCTPWETRIEDQANLESPMIAGLVDLQILYCAASEYMDKFNSYKHKALDALAKPVGADCIGRASRHIDGAKQEYTNMLLSENIGIVRYASCELVSNLVTALTNLNNTYLKRGLKRVLEEIRTYRHVPEDFEQKYMAVIDARTIDEIRYASFTLLASITGLYAEMYREYVVQPVPDYHNLAGSYEELWCNCRNKIIDSVERGDKSYAYHAAMSAQSFLNEMTACKGTPVIDLLQYFDAEHLEAFKERFLQAMDMYLEEYNKAGRTVARYDTFEQLYEHFMKM